ncbi:hypothetical protein I35_7764 [Burkholderia cenocepacia H111]|nr:hypothetical protein I35_7764 [Burkholderia cenocepacia H111]
MMHARATDRAGIDGKFPPTRAYGRWGSAPPIPPRFIPARVRAAVAAARSANARSCRPRVATRTDCENRTCTVRAEGTASTHVDSGTPGSARCARGATCRARESSSSYSSTVVVTGNSAHTRTAADPRSLPPRRAACAPHARCSLPASTDTSRRAPDRIRRHTRVHGRSRRPRAVRAEGRRTGETRG